MILNQLDKPGYLLFDWILMTHNTSKIWLNVLDLTQRQIGTDRFNLWFKNVKMHNYNEGCTKIVVPNSFVKSWFEENFSSILRENIRTVTSEKVDLQFTVDENFFDKKKNSESPNVPDERGNNKEIEENEENSCKTQLKPAKPAGKMLVLNDFVVGPCNQLAYASAMEIMKPENHSFNALFIHGPVGVGKTHLLQGMRNEINRSCKGIKAAYLPAECWTNEFIYSLQKGKLETFRNKYRNLDVLLIDDVHFVSNKHGVQEELLHTFNSLYGLSKRVVFASDAHPKFINKLKESLSSRFMTGMVTKIESPDYKTAYMILDTKLKKLKREFPEAVLEYIASTFINNIRELECALTTVLAVSNITKRSVDISLAKEALEEHIPKKTRTISIKDIEEAITRHYSVTQTELHSSNRSNSISFPRQVAMYLATILTNFSQQQIGAHFGGKKHTTVIHAVKKIKAKISLDAETRRLVEMIKDEICRN